MRIICAWLLTQVHNRQPYSVWGSGHRGLCSTNWGKIEQRLLPWDQVVVWLRNLQLRYHISGTSRRYDKTYQYRYSLFKINSNPDHSSNLLSPVYISCSASQLKSLSANCLSSWGFHVMIMSGLVSFRICRYRVTLPHPLWETDQGSGTTIRWSCPYKYR